MRFKLKKENEYYDSAFKLSKEPKFIDDFGRNILEKGIYFTLRNELFFFFEEIEVYLTLKLFKKKQNSLDFVLR